MGVLRVWGHVGVCYHTFVKQKGKTLDRIHTWFQGVYMACGYECVYVYVRVWGYEDMCVIPYLCEAEGENTLSYSYVVLV